MVVFVTLIYGIFVITYSNSLQDVTQHRIIGLNDYLVKVVKNGTKQQGDFARALTNEIVSSVHNDTRTAISNITSEVDSNFNTTHGIAILNHQIQTQNNQLLKELTAQGEKLLELQPLLFNSLSANQTVRNEVIPSAPSHVYFLTDAFFSDMGWGHQGLIGAKSINATVLDRVPIPDIVHSLIAHAAKNPKLIIAQGFQWGDPALVVAKNYPHTKFVIMTGLTNSTNVASIYPEQQQASFVLGAIAAMLSKTHVIGFVGGQLYPNIINIDDGYIQGAHYINPKITVLTNWTYDFNNVTKGGIAANNEIDHHADVLLHVADTSGQGVIEAANERNVTALGAVADQNHTLTSFVIDMKKAYGNALNDTGIIRPGLEAGLGAPGNGIVYIAPFHKSVPPAIQARTHQIINDIISGKIIVPERNSPIQQ